MLIERIPCHNITMNLIDTHCHLDDAIFDEDRDSILDNCHRLGINKIIIPSTRSMSWDKTISVSNKYIQTFLTLGLHPIFINKHTEKDIELLNKYVLKYKPIAIGEIGLDYYIKDTDKKKQLDIFSQQLDIAEQHKLPVVLHVRKSHDDIIKALQNRSIPGGTSHAFNGNIEQAKKYIDLGFKLGFGGTLTYPNARKIHQLAKDLPIESIVLETDAPDMSGHNHKGERNSPEYLPEALIALAKIKDTAPENIAEQTTQNACSVFNI